MSLINNMLRDLDSRHADAMEGSLPADVRPLPRPDGAGRGPGAVLLGLTFLAAVTAGAWWWLQSGKPPAAPDAPSRPAPVVRPAPAPIAAVRPEAPATAASPAEPPAPPAAAMPASPPAPAARPAAPKSAAAVPRDKKPLRPVPEIQGDTGLRLATAIAGNVPAEPAARRSVATATDAAATRIDKSPHMASARDRAETEYQKGFGLMRQGRTTEAIGQFHAALREDPTHVPARNGLLNVLVENHRLAEAEEVLRQGIGQQPVNLSWVVSLARLRIEQANTAGAWEALQAHAQIGTASSDFQGLAGVVLQKLGRMKEAGEHYQSATRIAPDNPRWWVGLGVAMEAEGRADAAREAYQRARALPGLSPELAGFVEQRLR